MSAKRGGDPAADPALPTDPMEDENDSEQPEQGNAAEGNPNRWDEQAVAGMSGRFGGGYGGGMMRKLAGAMPMAGAAPRMMAMPCAAPMMAMACAAAPMSAAAAPAGRAIGFKTGGAQDVGNFRQNIAAGKLPLPSDVTFEGLCKEYFFDTSSSDAPPVTELFAPAYSLALAPDPLLAAGHTSSAAAGAPAAQQQQQQQQQQQDVFLAVGLDSGVTDFKRPRLNLAILLDVSGSMDARFDRYYYDGASGAQELEGAEASKTKLDVAKEVIHGMLDRLAPDDSVAISLFSDSAATPKRLGRWGAADAAGIKAGIAALRTIGATNFQAGLDEAAAQLRGAAAVVDGDPATTENRIIVLTDAQPNAGEINEEGLLARLKAASADRVYCTLAGVGLDFNSELVEKILKCRGANYLSVHSPGEFKQRLDDEFDFMVAPLVFDLELRIDPASLAAAEGAAASGASGSAAGGGWRVLHVYGSPDEEARRLSGGGSIMRVHTLFPAAKSEEGIKGGVVLLRLAPPPGATTAAAPPLRLEARYTDRSGRQYSTLRAVEVPPEAGDVAGSEAEGPTAFYQSSGVRKAVLLARLTDALQGWLVDQWKSAAPGGPAGPDDWDAAVVQGLSGQPPPPAPAPAPRQRGQPEPLHLRAGHALLPPAAEELACFRPPAWRPSPWERQSRPLVVGPEAKAAFRQLLPWVDSEAAALGDASMGQEAALLRTLAGSA